jgi:hypothetical protein
MKRVKIGASQQKLAAAFCRGIQMVSANARIARAAYWRAQP